MWPHCRSCPTCGPCPLVWRGHSRPLVHAMLPIGLKAVAGANHDVDGQDRTDCHLDGLADLRPERDGCDLHVPSSRGVLRPVLWPAQVLRRTTAALRPDPHRLLQKPVAGRVLLDDGEDRELVELHGRVHPVKLRWVARLNAGWFALAYRA